LGLGSVLVLWLVLMSTPRPVHANTLCVKPGGGDGCLASINAALAAAQANDTIRVAAGFYNENVLISQTITLQGGWSSDFSIYDPNVFSSTIQPQDDTQSVVAIQGQFGDTAAVAPTLAGFVITAGRADLGSNHGGGLRIVDSNALVISNTIQNNVAFFLGGGVWVQRGAPILQGNSILNNQSVGLGQNAYGGGLQLENTQAILLDNILAGNIVSGTEAYGGGLAISGAGSGQVTLMRNQFISNTAALPIQGFGFGGGIAVNSGQALLINSTMFSNTATANGGGLFIGTSAVFSFTNSAIIANLAGQDGGAIYNTGVFSISNVTISGNSASGMGGGIANLNLVSMVNTTVANNNSSNGAGLFNLSTVHTTNSLIALNNGDNCLGVLNSQGHNLEDGGTCALGQPTDMSNTSAAMAQLAENGGRTPTHALAADSPAIDAGDNSACPAIDQRGVSRPVDGDEDGTAICDIGAFEYGSSLYQLYLPFLTDTAPQVYGRNTATPNTGLIHFQQDSYSVVENAGAVTVVVERTNGSSGEVTVGVDTFDGTATAGQDYPATAETVTFADGETEKTVSIPIFDNNTAEPDETFLATLNLISGAATIIEPSTTTITILDDDTTPPGVLHFSVSAYAVLEDSGILTITVQRSGGTNDEVQVSYETMNGTAVSGSDYMSALGTLTFPDGETEQTFTIMLLDDPGDEGSETFTIQLSNVVGVATLGEPSTAIVTIIDDETADFLYLPLVIR
jgi:hypothetical protein